MSAPYLLSGVWIRATNFHASPGYGRKAAETVMGIKSMIIEQIKEVNSVLGGDWQVKTSKTHRSVILGVAEKPGCYLVGSPDAEEDCYLIHRMGNAPKPLSEGEEGQFLDEWKIYSWDGVIRFLQIASRGVTGSEELLEKLTLVSQVSSKHRPDVFASGQVPEAVKALRYPAAA